MDLDNVALLVVSQTPPLERRERVEGPEKEAEFLSLRLLNKRGRVRLSPARIDFSRLPGKSSLLAVGNVKGLLAAAVCDGGNSHKILVSSLSDLRAAFESGKPDPEPFIPFTSSPSPFSVPGTPIILKFALNDERLVVGFLEGPVLVYNTNDLFGSSHNPNYIFTFPGDASTIPRDISSNPGDSPELVAIMRGVHGQEPGHQVDIIDVQNLKHVAGWRKGSDPDVIPVSLSWSPKGKQIAIGLQSGDMIMYSPLSANSPKSHIVKPRSTPRESSSLLSTTWLSNPTFHTVFSTPEASSVLFDPSMSESPTQTHFVSTHDFKTRSALDVELRDPCPPFGAKRPPGPLSVVLRNWNPTKFIIFCGGGASSDIGVIGTLPSDDPQKPGDQWVSFNLEETSTPSLPLDEDLNDLALLGLEIDLTSSKSIRMSEQPDDGTPDLPPSPILYAYTSDGTVVAWHVLNSSGQAYPGMNAVESVSTTQATSQQLESMQTIGMTSPRVSSPPSIFDQKAPSSPQPTNLAFGTPASSSPLAAAAAAPAPGFGAFGAFNTSSKLGSAGFGFGGGPTPSVVPAFGSTGFGVGNANQGEQPKSTSSPAFGTSAFGSISTTQQKPAPSPAFGSTGFGQAGAAFGKTGFGSSTAAPAFGQSGFGVTPSGTAKPAGGFGSTGGGFAAFATQGSSAFGAPVDPSSASKTTPAPSVFGQASFGQTSSAFAPQSAFGAGGQGQASAPASAFGSGGVGQASKAASSSTSAFGQQGQPQSAFGGFGQKDGTQLFGKTAFGDSTTPPPRESGSFGGFGAFNDALKPGLSPARFGSPSGSPTSPAGSPPDSPELRPASQPVKPTSSYLKPAAAFGSMNMPSERFGSSGTGAIKTSSSFIKPAEGFGALAQSKSPTTTTFGQQKPASPAFGTTGFSSARTSSTTPTFGSTSALGHTKPVFGTSSFGSTPQPAATEPSKPVTGGFSAFSSSGGGFASFASTGKSASFADILSSGGADKPKTDTTPLAFGAPSASKVTDVPAFGVLSEKEVSSTFSTNIQKSTGAFSSRSSRVERDGSDEEKEDETERFSEDKLTSQEPTASALKTEEPSFSQLSLGEPVSQTSPSAATPAAELSPDEPEIKPTTEKTDESNKEPEEGEETVSEPFSFTDDGLEESASEKESIDASVPTTPHDRASLSTATPAATPTIRDAQLPEVDETLQPPQPPLPPSDVGDASTTPPGSPAKSALAAQMPLPAPAAQVAVIPVSTTSPFGLGMGRPSSRPIRSSPLASAPILSAEDEDLAPEVPPSKSAPPTSKAQPAETKVPIGKCVPTAPLPATTPPVIPLTPKPHRPSTPPLLGTSSTPIIAPQQSRVSATGLAVHPRVVSSVPHTTSVSMGKEEIPQHPMQIEFLRAYQEITQELVQLYQKAQETTAIRPVISEPRGMDKFLPSVQEFIPGQYSHGDLKTFAKMIEILQKKTAPLTEQGNTGKRSLRDLQNLALISETKLEEVSRWLRARQDPDFAKSLGPRTLGPEHSENQVRLRKALQLARDRTQQCEDEIEALKRRLEQHKSGKVGLRPPTLDTIDRTCRNIQLALEERIKLLERLHDRIGALSPRASKRLQSSQSYTRSQVSSIGSVTPPFASVAAAALNSERSSLKLKTVLLASRKEPLLTTKITKSEHSRHILPRSQRPEWKLPPVPPLDMSTSSQSSSSLLRRGSRTGKKHGAIQLKEGLLGSGVNTVVFDWGSLPKAAPMDKLSMDVRPKMRNVAKHFGDDLTRNQEAAS